MKLKLNPITWEFNLVPDGGQLKQKLNPLTWEFNLTTESDFYDQKFNPISGEFNLYPWISPEYIIETVTGNMYVNLTNALAHWLLSLTAYGWTEQDWTPTPDTPVDIVCNNGAIKFWILSKNLLDMSESNIILGKYINNSWGVAESSFNFYNSKYIPVKPSTTYTWSTSAIVSYLSIMEYNSNKQFLKRTLFTNGATTLSDNITLRADTAYVLLWSNMDSATVTYEKISAVDRQLEEWNTATSYVPYEEWIYTDWTTETISSTLSTATAEMLLKVWDYQDEQEILSWNITRRVGVKVLDGSEEYLSSPVWCYTLAEVVYSWDIESRRVVCTHFDSTDTVPSSGTWRQGLSFLTGTGNYRICFGITSTYNTVAEFKQWLTDQYNAWTPIIVVYPLATPTTESVAGQTMNIPAGNSTIEITEASLDNLELSAKYKALP